MDIIELLSNDQTEVDELFDRFEKTDDAAEQDEIARQVVHDLSVHAAVEEQFVYPLIRVKLQGTVADHAIEEHQEVKQLLSDLEKAEAGTADHRNLMERVAKSVRHHVEEEEGNIFPKLRSETDEGTREKLGSVVENAKGLVPTHPHPLVPGTATAQLAAGPWATVIDKVRDLLGAGPR
jgi:hemerythrin superfamily protein